MEMLFIIGVIFAVLGLLSVAIVLLIPGPVLPIDEAAVFMAQNPCYYEQASLLILDKGRALDHAMMAEVERSCDRQERGQAYLDELIKQPALIK